MIIALISLLSLIDTVSQALWTSFVSSFLRALFLLSYFRRFSLLSRYVKILKSSLRTLKWVSECVSCVWRVVRWTVTPSPWGGTQGAGCYGCSRLGEQGHSRACGRRSSRIRQGRKLGIKQQSTQLGTARSSLHPRTMNNLELFHILCVSVRDMKKWKNLSKVIILNVVYRLLIMALRSQTSMSQSLLVSCPRACLSIGHY